MDHLVCRVHAFVRPAEPRNLQATDTLAAKLLMMPPVTRPSPVRAYEKLAVKLGGTRRSHMSLIRLGPRRSRDLTVKGGVLDDVDCSRRRIW